MWALAGTFVEPRGLRQTAPYMNSTNTAAVSDIKSFVRSIEPPSLREFVSWPEITAERILPHDSPPPLPYPAQAWKLDKLSSGQLYI